MNLHGPTGIGFSWRLAWGTLWIWGCCGALLWAEPARLGDLNEDGVATIQDVVLILDHIHGRDPLEPNRISFADVNRDGLVDQIDVDLVAEAAVSGLLLKEIDFRPGGLVFPGFSLANDVELVGNNFPRTRVLASSPYEKIEAVSDDRGRFTLDLPLLENQRFDFFVAGFGADGERLGNEPIRIIQDSLAPSLAVSYPTDGWETDAEEIVVAGRVQDALSGSQGLYVDVAGEPARLRVGNGIVGTFLSEPISLEIGENEISVLARDEAGNETEKRFRVIRVDRPATQLSRAGGDQQRGEVGSVLNEALRVQVKGPGGRPLGGKLVVFERLSDLGMILSSDEQELGEVAFVETDSDGLAAVKLRLSQEAGEGSHLVRARSRDIHSDVTFVASALPRAESQLSLVTGDGQFAPPLAFAIEPLRVWMHDGRNALRDRAIRFEILSGGGTVNGRDRVTVLTDAGGFAEVRFQFGAAAGLQQVVARTTDDLEQGVVFNLFGRDPVGGETGSVVGVLVTPYFRAVSEAVVTLLVEGALFGPVTTDASGLFQIGGVSTGAAELRVWPTEAAFNESRSPVGIRRFYRHLDSGDYFIDPIILPLTLERSGALYDGTTDLELSLPGLSQLTVTLRAGSVRFADGSEPSGDEPVFFTLKQVPVTALPTIPPLAELPAVAWLLEPAQIRLTEPAKLSLPDLEGVAAEASPRSFAWDSSLQAFVPLTVVGTGDERGVLLTQGGFGFVSTRFQTGRVALGESPRDDLAPDQ